ncbi:hypothetical protein ACIRA2_29330 [Streptomyces griseoviridis]
MDATAHRGHLKELLDLVRELNWRAWPPRLPAQPIFYLVLNEGYAVNAHTVGEIRMVHEFHGDGAAGRRGVPLSGPGLEPRPHAPLMPRPGVAQAAASPSISPADPRGLTSRAPSCVGSGS